MRIIGLDVGEVRIGVALSDPNQTTAFPHTVIDRSNDAAAIAAIARLAIDQEAGMIVYGQPMSLGGSLGPQAAATEDFISRLRVSIDIPLYPQDERLTSTQARRVLIAQGVKRGKRREIIDKMAAAIILQSYLDGANDEHKR